MRDTTKQSSFKIQFDFAEKQYLKMGKTIEKIKLWFEIDDIDGAYFEAFNLADESEKLTLTTRILPAFTGNPQAFEISNQIITDNIPVKIGFTPEGWFTVIIPMLLPKKYKGSVKYINEFLYPAMQNFFREKQPVKYDDCVIVFRHIYKRDRPERRYRDHDNIEVNAVINIIALYVLYDDSPLRCEHYYCSAAGDEDRTEVFVVPQNEITTWIADVKTNQNRELILYENRQ